jgi:hypothetical protein
MLRTDQPPYTACVRRSDVVSIQPILASLGEPAQAPRIAPAARMTTNTPEPEPEPRYERYRVAYPSETVVQACYCDGATLGKVRVTHPLAVVEAIEGSLVNAR